MKHVVLKRILLTAAILFLSFSAFGSADFELTKNGVRYVVRDDSGNVTQVVAPSYDPASGKYYVKDESTQAVYYQSLPSEAGRTQIKIVTPVEGESHSVQSKGILGTTLPVLKELPSTDSRYSAMKDCIEQNTGLQKVLAMQIEARDMKIQSLSKELNSGTKDPSLTAWLVSDLKKPIYLEVGDSGTIYHDPKGFVLAEQGSNGQISYRDNSNANRVVVPGNSEVFASSGNSAAASSVIAHEVGHMVMDQTYETPNYPKTGYAGSHSKDSITDEGFAISEGWAEAFETLANKDNLNDTSSWRIQSQKNIAENKYIFKNQEVVDGVNDGILKTGAQQLSTEGVNASLFYKMLTDYKIQSSYEKVLTVFNDSKPQTYRDFVKSYIEKYPEDRSRVIQQFLENTKYTTVDSNATAKYKEVFDAEQAYLSADSPDVRAQLKQEYQAKLDNYNQWKDEVYKQTVVDGQIDRAVGGSNGEGAYSASYSDETGKQYGKIKLSETILKGKKAIGVGLDKAVDSVKQSLSVKNIAITAGTSIAINLASQIMNGQKVSLKDAVKTVASTQFVGNVLGSTLGAATGHVIAPLIQTFVPIPIVGALAGSLIPTFMSIAGGQFGSNLGSGLSLKEAFKNLDPVAIAGQTVGSTVGAILGSMIPIPYIGTMLGGMIGGIIGEKIFTGIAKLFGRDKNKTAATNVPVPGIPNTPSSSGQTLSTSAYSGGTNPAALRLDSSIDNIPYDSMNPNLRAIHDQYEKAYKDYVSAANSGNQSLAKSRLTEFTQIRDRYKMAIGIYGK